MKKINLAIGSFISIMALIIGFFGAAPLAQAQYAYPTYSTGYGYPQTTCISLSYDLGIGSSGQMVTSLQSFLMSRGYLSIAYPTGYFGIQTQTGVRAYQYARSLPNSGIADAITRQAINSESCGGTAYNNQYNNQYNNNYQNNYSNCYTSGYYVNGYYVNGNSNSNCSNNSSYYNYAPTLSSLSTYSGAAGTYITAYGSGFDAYNNTVTIGSATVTGVASSNNGTVLTFSIPQTYSNSNNNNGGTYCTQTYPVQCYNNYNNNYYNSNQYVQSGTYAISITTSHGTSNSLQFSITANNNGYYNNSNVTLYSVNPTAAHIGNTVTLYGTGFSTSNNTVYVGPTIVSGIPSYDGSTLSFTLPYSSNSCSYNNCNNQYLSNGQYSVYVQTGSGYQSNNLTLTVY